MKRKYMERLIGQYCKIVTKEPGDKRASVVTGTLEDVDLDDGFILVDSAQGLGCLRISTVIAIKPGRKHKSNNKRKIKHNQHAAIGIGTLIVFIALVLVAAVASSIIIETSENLQNRAYAVGKQTIREVSSGLKIVDLIGYSDAEKSKLEYLAISISPRAGSYDIDLNATLVYIEYDNLTVLTLDYADANAPNGGSITGTVSANGVFQTLNLSCLGPTDYGAIAIRDTDNSVVNTYGLGTKDMVMVIINLTATFPETGGIEPGEEFYGRFVPEEGAAGIFYVNAPNAFDHRVVEL